MTKHSNCGGESPSCEETVHAAKIHTRTGENLGFVILKSKNTNTNYCKTIKETEERKATSYTHQTELKVAGRGRQT